MPDSADQTSQLVARVRAAAKAERPRGEAQLPSEAPGGVDPREVEADAQQLGPEHHAARQEEEQGQERRPERRGGAGDQLAGVVGEPEALRQIARELEVDPTVVQRKAEPAPQPRGLGQEISQAGREAGQEQQKPQGNPLHDEKRSIHN